MDKKLSIAMISGPQDDMRHTGHVGFDGTTFGDVAFIVDNYDKLPKKIQPGGEWNWVVYMSHLLSHPLMTGEKIAFFSGHVFCHYYHHLTLDRICHVLNKIKFILL